MMAFCAVRFEFRDGVATEGQLPADVVQHGKTIGICARQPDGGGSAMTYLEEIHPQFSTHEKVYIFREKGTREWYESIGAVPPGGWAR